MVQSGGLPSGRERAIETLIDMEPQGAFYRAARVLDEVVPQALLNRPNIVTKAALVEQANSLAEHEITLSNYDAVFGSSLETSSNHATTTASAASGGASSSGLLLSLPTAVASSSSSKERILRHHAKQCSILQHQQQQRKKSYKQQQQQHAGISSAATSSTTTPSPQLVAVLRQVYGTTTADSNDSAPAFSFPSLLKAVMDHKVFETPHPTTATTTTTTVTKTTAAAAVVAASADPEASADANPSGGEETSTDNTTTAAAATTTTTPAATVTKGINKEGGNAPAAQVESLIANVCRLADEKDQPTTNILQGLLVAALSVLTQTTNPESDADHTGNNNSRNKGDAKNNTSAVANKDKSGSSKSNKKAVAEDPSASPALRVGSILSLLKLNDLSSSSSSSSRTHNNNDNTSHVAEGYQLDQELVDYFGQAAVAYEGRIEIQKARLLAKLQQEAAAVKPSPSAETTAADPMAEAPVATSIAGPSDVTPVAALAPTETSRTAGVSNNDNNTGTAVEDSVGQLAATQVADDQVAILEEGDAGHPERLAEATLATTAALEQIISSATGDDSSADEEADISSGSDSDEEMEGVMAADADGTRENRSDGEGPDGEAGSPATDDEVDAQEEDEESSSSSSADDWAMMEERAARSDGDQEDEEDDDDDEDDDEDDDVLQQALALSLSEHNSRGQNENETSGTQEDHAQDADHADESSSALNDDAPAASESDGLELNEGRPLMEVPTKSESAYDDDDDDDDGASSLPPLPAAPSAHPYASLLGHPVELDSEQTSSMESIFAPYFDPSALTKFGSIPTSNVLVHLLRYTTGIIEQSESANSISKESAAYSDSNNSSVAGGIGCSLFPPSSKQGIGSNFERNTSESRASSGIPVTVQLLVAFFLQIMEKRDEAITGLRTALQEVRHEQGEDIAEESTASGEGVKSDSSPLSSEEEDDPAVALAMTYAEDTVAESAESLEAKGMMRKAAAAAHDAAALLNLLRRRTESWKQNVKLLSLCAVYALKSLRLFLQSTVRERLRELASKNGHETVSSDSSDFLPAHVGSKLSMSLASAMSISAHNSFAAMLNDDESEINDVFLPLSLYKEAVATWGEIIPLVYPSTGAQVELLRNLISECSPRSGVEATLHFRPLESLTNMPLADMEPQVHRLEFLCKRLRVADMLDTLVPSPTCYAPDLKPAQFETNADARKNREPFRASPVVSLLVSAVKDVCGGKGELQRLFLALCHRFHSRVLLWGGLYESSESDVEDVAGAAVAQSSTSSGDLVRIGATPSTSLQFDATKCSDSIAILGDASANGSSVHQRASKVWGTVLSTHCYSPKTGVHRWAVRLDKCERGHVFVGVATSQAQMRTYVGGDKYGWGMIGTQALWHDRRKIRGDYGATFRTGSTIVVTLDTNAGTLGFSSWKDSSSSSSFSLDPLLQNQSAARRQGHTGGTVDDWGIAFEGLPLNAKIYPAVGLYQRDDRVTLLTVENMRSAGPDGGLATSGGACYYPLLGSLEDSRRTKAIAQVRRFNDTLSWEGVQYVLDSFQHIERCLEDNRDEFVLATLLPSLAAALCLVPNSIPWISERLALTLLPQVGKLLMKLDRYGSERQMVHELFRTGVRPGKWIIRATGSPGETSDFEEYVVDFSSVTNEQGGGGNIGFEGSGVGTTGKSKNGLVTIFGTTNGSHVHFVEEWSDGSDEGFGATTPDETSSCVVAARLSLDGRKFEGTYRNVQFGTSGQIAGTLHQEGQSSISKFRLKDAPASSPSSKQSAELADAIVTGESVLCLAFNHMATIVGEDAAGDQLINAVDGTSAAVKTFLSGKLLRGSSLAPAKGVVTGQLKLLREHYAWENDYEDPHECRNLFLLDSAALEKSIGADATKSDFMSNEDIESKVSALDEGFGRKGSLRGLCPNEYDDARKHIISTLIRPCHLHDCLTSGNSAGLVPVWQTALHILEDGLRQTMSDPKEGQCRKEACVFRCKLYIRVSKFLCTLEFSDAIGVSVEDAAREISSFYQTVRTELDIQILQKEMEASSRRSLLRLVSLQQVINLFLDSEKSDDNFIALESLVVGLPRVLGRSPTDPLNSMRKPGSGLDARALFSAGSDRLTRHALRSCTLKLFCLLGRIAARAISSESVMSVDSLILSLLAVFTMTLKNDDVHDEVVRESGIINIVKDVLSQHAHAMAADNSSHDVGHFSVVRKLQEIFQQGISRSVLRLSVAAAHTVIFHCQNQAENETSTRIACFDLLFDEMNRVVLSTEKLMAEATLLAVTRRKETAWEKWSGSFSQPHSREKRIKARQVGLAGLIYLQENGTTQSYGPPSTSQKPSSRQKSKAGISSRNSPESITRKLQSGFAFQLLSQWLHVLCGVLNKNLPIFLSGDPKWITLLLGATGLSVDFNSSGSINNVAIRESTNGLLPARFRSRILRFLLPLLDSMEPNADIVVGLVRLAGSAPPISPSLDEDAKLVNREAVTLLRQLHSPSRALWRNIVNQTISTSALVAKDASFQLGVLAFFSGNLEAIGCGSYVLLKPAAAAPLSVDQQSSPSSKHSSGVGGTGSGIGATPHHIVGSGTEGIVAGLARHDASAGLVSNIDMKNGICEVVLLSRDTVDPEEPAAESLLLSKPLTGPANPGPLTVRALRTALSDVVHAQEAPLFLDETMTFDTILGSLVEPALVSLFSVMGRGASLDGLGTEKHTNVDTGEGGDIAGLASGLMNISSAIMLLRSAIVVLSDKRIASGFLQKESSKKVLAKILRLALPTEIEEKQDLSDYVGTTAQKCFLSSLPLHEARYFWLVSMLRDVSARNEALAAVSEDEWAERIEELRTRQLARRDEENKDIATTAEGDKTPSADLAGSGLSQTGVGSSNASGSADVDSNSRNADSSNRGVSQSTLGSNSDDDEDDEEEDEAAAAAAAHLREAAIAQMAELGLPRSWSEFALRRTGGDIEAAVHFLLENGGEMERLLAEERSQAGGGQPARRRGHRGESGSSNLLRQLLEMGFPSRWCTLALGETGNNVDEALTWILTHGERLSEEDEALEEENEGEDADEDEEDDDEEDDDEDDEDNDEVASVSAGDGSTSEAVTTPKAGDSAQPSSDDSTLPVWSGSVVPLRFISGRSIIDSKTLAISGLPTGGFSSVGTKGILLCSGKWYYEAILETAGCLQIGWADGSFAGHCHADRGDGTGDGPSSWAFDGWRRYRWHSTATEWGCRWKEGDVIGCLVDMDEFTVSFTLNGRAEEIGMGVAFSGEGFRPCGGVYACVSFNRREKLRLQLSEPFTHQPPPGYQGVGTAVLEAVKEREMLALKEQILDGTAGGANPPEPKRFLCDFSFGEHGHELMAWAHRYYGSDASVHLGSGRSKQTTGGVPKSSATIITDSPATVCVTRRVEKVWASAKEAGGEASSSSTEKNSFGRDEVVSKMKEGYVETSKQLDRQLVNESAILAVLFARKLILHLVVTMGEDFDLDCFRDDDTQATVNARLFFGVIESCASLRCAGWVGEAGAMAIAAEALGLGISSNDHGHSRQSSSERAGMASVSDLLDEGVILPAGGITQLLSSVMRSNVDANAIETGSLLAACSEAALGSDGGGGVLVFLQKGLQSAVCRSLELRNVLSAAVRRSIRLLAVVEYEGDDSESSSDPIEENADTDKEKKANQESVMLPDARLTSFLTGLLISTPVEVSVSKQDYLEVLQDLFQAWSIGMLSASLPWRMVCAFTVAGILNKCPDALLEAVSLFPTLARFYGRLESTVARRVWAERAAVPVCSRYIQAMMELLTSVKRAVSGQRAVSGNNDMPLEFMKFWGKLKVDAATPLPRSQSVPALTSESYWESDDGWISSDTSWELWTGTVQYMAVEWDKPIMSPVRTLMDGGEGPPMLREGCFVMRGSDWSKEGSDEDGKKSYEAEKAKREKEKRRAEEEAKEEAKETSEDDPAAPLATDEDENPAAATTSYPTAEPTPQDPAAVSSTVPSEPPEASTPTPTDAVAGTMAAKKQKKKKIPSPKLPVGTVLSVEPWNGQPGLGRRVRWHLTGKEGVYRYGGDGGRYDISHIEINDKSTRVKKRHPLPESAEQCASRHGFGANRKYNVILRLQHLGNHTKESEGILEWPDFGAGVSVTCTLHADGAVTVMEKHLLFGSKDSGWEARFGQPCFVPGSSFVLRAAPEASNPSNEEVSTQSPFSSFYEELLCSTSYQVASLRNRADGEKLSVSCEMRLFRGRQKPRSKETAKIGPVQAPTPPPIHFDRDYHASSLSLSRDGRTVSCVSSEGRGTAFASVGFSKGVHYWEVKLEQADIGSVFIGVAEKPNSSGSGGAYDTPPRLNRWPGFGFVNFRATYSSGAERVYGAHCSAGDTVGVLLDCDAGRVSFFFDGLKYGEHILNDLGTAFQNLSPFGFNVDGCGSGGAGQGAPSGIEGGRGGQYPAQGSVRPRALWPVIGLRNQGDRVTISPKWTTSYGVDGVTATKNVLAVDEILCSYDAPGKATALEGGTKQVLPEWFVSEAFREYQRWHSGKWKRAVTRGSGPFKHTSFGLDVDLDASSIACATACAALGMKHALLAGDRVRLLRSAGRILELAEEAVILGAHQGRLFYQIVSQKSEGGSLTEGGGRAWFFDESEVCGGLPFVGKGRAEDIVLPLMDRFSCQSPGGLKIAYDGGAVVRSDLEIIDGSMNLGVIAVGTVIPKNDVLERRVNSCGVKRYRVRAKLGEEMKEGWISARIRGGKEEAIVEPVQAELDDLSSEANEIDTKSFPTALDSALAWKEEFDKVTEEGVGEGGEARLAIADISTFKTHLENGFVQGMSATDSDSLLSATIGAISNFDSGDSVDCSFQEIFSALEFALASKKGTRMEASAERSNPAANQAAAHRLASVKSDMPPVEAVMARAAVLRAFNRRARRALPWMSVRPCQEGSAIFGGLCGHGASTERSGRTRLRESQALWVQTPSIATRIRTLRGLFFSSVKVGFLESISSATATPTPLSHDEYELPREIRTVRINRLRSKMAMAGTDNGAKRKYSVFAQLHNETKGWGGAALRRGYIAKGHGGQRRAFKVKLIGEGVNDYSGPYREAFTDAFSEVLNIDPASSRGSLGVLDPTPNNSADLGENRELCMFSVNGRELSGLKNLLGSNISEEEKRIWKSFSSLTAPRDEPSREVEEALVFLGRLTGTAYRHGIPVDLPLPLHAVWNPIVEEESKDEDRLRELDELAFRQSTVETFSPLLWWQQRMLNSFVEGMSNVLPVEVLSLLDGEELRGLMCGNEDVDVDLLRSVVEYEGYVETDNVIEAFWETLRELSNTERKLFLQFVWARNRLPLKKSDFEAPFKIQRDSANTGKRADQALPSASTCFFSLALPEYSSKEILKEKLLFALRNVSTMETDFQTNSAEIAEGYRAF